MIYHKTSTYLKLLQVFEWSAFQNLEVSTPALKTVLKSHFLWVGLKVFFVQAGASHVYAIEASPQMAAAARQIVKDNGFSNVVTVIEGLVEDAEIPVRMMTRFDS